ncbi:MAG: nucleotide exchange factor GrpE [Anaerolineae bacterium]|nr:nucleotide exchange factor GrpE [Anaerolineae bacterium]
MAKAKERIPKDKMEEANSPPETPAEMSKSGKEIASERKEEQPMIALTISEYEKMQQDVEQMRKEAQEHLESWQRERADFKNYKNRIEREQETLRQTLSGGIIKKYLVILDDMERALKNRPTQGEGSSWADGIELIFRKLQNILESEGVTRIPAEEELFDPNRHEAISHEESKDHKSGEIIEVIQQGYLIGDRVLRPALVRVAK